MNKKHIVRNFNILVNDKCSNIDAKYGPYNSLAEAFNTLDNYEYLAVGLTVGIITDEGIVEYWFKDKCSSISDLVLKNKDIDQSNSLFFEDVDDVSDVYPEIEFRNGQIVNTININ